MVKEKYDFFISYKSENANSVRQIVEILILNNLKVWFAEYQILLANYHEFESHVIDGIVQSEYALIFTNNLWTKSKYCQDEFQHIINNITIDNILEVQIPKESMTYLYNPILQKAKSIEYNGDIKEIIEFITANTQFTLPDRFIGQTYPNEDKGMLSFENRFGLTLDLGDFKPVDNSNSTTMFQKFLGFSDFKANFNEITVYLSIAYPPLTSISNFYIKGIGEIEDIDIYDYYRSIAEMYLSESDSNNIGLHLFFKDGYSNMALTSVYEDKNKDFIFYSREYFIRNKQEFGEIRLNFNIKIPREHEVNAFKIFLKFTGYLDSIAGSISLMAKENYQYYNYIFSKAITAIILLMLFGTNPILVTILVTDYILSVYKKNYLCIFLRMPCPSEKMPYFKRTFFKDLIYRISYNFYNILLEIVLGLYDIRSSILIAFGIIFQIQISWYWATILGLSIIIGMANQIRILKKEKVILKDAKSWVPGAPRLKFNENLLNLSPAIAGLILYLLKNQTLYIKPIIIFTILFSSVGISHIHHGNNIVGYVFLILSIFNCFYLIFYKYNDLKIKITFYKKSQKFNTIKTYIDDKLLKASKKAIYISDFIILFLWSLELNDLKPNDPKNLYSLGKLTKILAYSFTKINNKYFNRLSGVTTLVARDIFRKVYRFTEDDEMKKNIIKESSDLDDKIKNRFRRFKISFLRHWYNL